MVNKRKIDLDFFILGPFVLDSKKRIFLCIFKNVFFKIYSKIVKIISNSFDIIKEILTFTNLNIHCSRFYIVKITYFFKMTYFKNDFYEKLFEIAFYFRDFFKILV